MKKLIISMSLAFATTLASPAFAGSFNKCTDVPQDKWKTQKEVEAIAAGAGYEVRKSKIDGTCYEVYGVGKDGALMELFYDPATGKLIHSKKKG